MVLYTWEQIFKFVNPIIQYSHKTIAPKVKIIHFIPKNSYIKTETGEIFVTYNNYYYGEYHLTLVACSLRKYPTLMEAFLCSADIWFKKYLFQHFI
jgi:hypothetical protein